MTREGLTSYLEWAFTQKGLQDRLPEARYVIEKESSWLWYAQNSKSKGLLAFTPGTWYDFCTEFGIYEDMNPHEQIDCMAKMWAKGLEYRWDTYCNAYRDSKCIELRGLYPGFLNK